MPFASNMAFCTHDFQSCAFFVLLGVVYLIDAIEMELLKLPHVLLAMCTVKRMYTVYYMLVVMVMVSGALAAG